MSFFVIETAECTNPSCGRVEPVKHRAGEPRPACSGCGSPTALVRPPGWQSIFAPGPRRAPALAGFGQVESGGRRMTTSELEALVRRRAAARGINPESIVIESDSPAQRRARAEELRQRAAERRRRLWGVDEKTFAEHRRLVKAAKREAAKDAARRGLNPVAAALAAANRVPSPAQLAGAKVERPKLADRATPLDHDKITSKPPDSGS